MTAEALGVWLGAGFTLCILSFLYKDNPFYKFAEHVFVGISAGYGVALQFHNVFLPNLWRPLIAGNLVMIVPQIYGNLLPLWGSDYLTSFNNWILCLGLIACLVYFFFSREHKGSFGFVARVGIYFLMISFGASFGYTVMSRMSLLIGRFYYLYGDWLHILPQ